MIPLFLVTGACASGKSYFVKELKQYFLNKNIRVHDFDEKIKLSKEEAIEFFFNITSENWSNKIYTILCGGITPVDLKNSKFYKEDFVVHACLLNVSESERRRRLLERNENFFNAVNNLNFTKEEVIKSIISGAEVYKKLLKSADDFVELDNSIQNDYTTLKKLVYWIEEKIDNYEHKF